MRATNKGDESVCVKRIVEDLDKVRVIILAKEEVKLRATEVRLTEMRIKLELDEEDHKLVLTETRIK